MSIGCKTLANVVIHSSKANTSQFQHETVAATYHFNSILAHTHTGRYACIQEILFSLQKNVKLKMTYRNNSAGSKVSEVLPDEPSGLSRGKTTV